MVTDSTLRAECAGCHVALADAIKEGVACPSCGSRQRKYYLNVERKPPTSFVSRLLRGLRRLLVRGRSSPTGRRSGVGGNALAPAVTSGITRSAYQRLESEAALIADSRTFSYKPAEVCIYCGSTNENLSNEHIIPYGLNGDLVLPEASCARCASLTSQLERTILRGELRHIRAALGLRTRRPQDRLATYPLTVVTERGRMQIHAPIEDHPVILPTPVFLPPAFLDRREYTSGVQCVGVRTIKWGPDPEEVAKRYGARQLSISVDTKPAEFARMLAKIGYCYAVAELGRPAFEDVFVLPAIFGRTGDIGRWVGAGPETLAIPAGALHYLQLDVVAPSDPASSASLAIVHVKLFANSPTPVYSVIVGTARTTTQNGPTSLS